MRNTRPRRGTNRRMVVSAGKSTTPAAKAATAASARRGPYDPLPWDPAAHHTPAQNRAASFSLAPDVIQLRLQNRSVSGQLHNCLHLLGYTWVLPPTPRPAPACAAAPAPRESRCAPCVRSGTVAALVLNPPTSVRMVRLGTRFSTEPPGSFPIPRLPEDGCPYGTRRNLPAQALRANACLAPPLAPRGVFCVLSA